MSNFKPASPTTTLKDLIHVKENLFSIDFCDLVIQEYCNDDSWFESRTLKKKDSPGSEFELSAVGRTSESLKISDKQVILKNLETRKKIDEEIFNSLIKELELYVSQTPYVHVTQDCGYTLLRYKPGCYFSEHCDALMGPARDLNGEYLPETFAPRHISAVVLLNNDYEGGELSFFNGEYKIPIKRGCGIFFPSYRLFPHQVSPVEKGIRYSIITFFS